MHTDSINRPRNNSFWSELMFSWRCFFLFCQGISELGQLILAKFSTMVRRKQNFIMQIQKIERPPLKNFRGQKHATLMMISDNFKLHQQIFPEQIKIFKIGQVLDRLQFILRSKSSELWSTFWIVLSTFCNCLNDRFSGVDSGKIGSPTMNFKPVSDQNFNTPVPNTICAAKPYSNRHCSQWSHISI